MFEISDDAVTAGGQVDDTAAIFHIINQHGKPLGDQLRDILLEARAAHLQAFVVFVVTNRWQLAAHTRNFW